nr:MAG TPA: hypothetical protein [Caudoviricetes sp.]
MLSSFVLSTMCARLNHIVHYTYSNVKHYLCSIFNKICVHNLCTLHIEFCARFVYNNNQEIRKEELKVVRVYRKV